jgi:endo-1,4-beta-xylanase
VGMQMHINIINPPSMNDVTTNMQRIAELGLQVHITELDVQIQGGQGTDQERLMQQAQLYGDVARVCISVEACTSLAMWGFTDQHTWIPAETGHPDAPLIFDQSYQPKPAYSALVAALSTNQ